MATQYWTLVTLLTAHEMLCAANSMLVNVENTGKLVLRPFLQDNLCPQVHWPACQQHWHRQLWCTRARAPPLELAHVGLHQIWQFLLTYNLQWAMVDCYWTQHITVPATFHTESVQFCSFAVYYIYVVISAWFHEHARRAPSPSPGSKCWQRH